MIALVLVYHLVLLVALALTSNALSPVELVMALALVGLGGAGLFEMVRSIEPRRPAPRKAR